MVMVRASETNPNGGEFLSAECDAILVVDAYREFAEGDDARIEVDLSIVAATVSDQIGKKVMKERFSLLYVPDRIAGFACAVGLYPYEQWQNDAKNKVNPDLPLADSEGRMFATPIRHRKWRDEKDTPYWQGRLEDAQAKASKGEEGADKEVEKCERILREKRGQLQIGGESGFKFWAIGDPEADHIPLSAEDMQLFPDGLPTKFGTFRHRGSNGHASGTKAAPPARQTSPSPAAATRPAPSAPAAAAAGVGKSFL